MTTQPKSNLTANLEALRLAIRDVPDFPKPGIMFKDITPILEKGSLFKMAINEMAAQVDGIAVSKIVAIESRGFIFGAALAHLLGVGLIPVRKPNKLPYKTESVEYSLEYGKDRLEMHVDALVPTDKVLIVDDVLATGGTAEATGFLCKKSGATVTGFSFFSELGFLSGRAKLNHDGAKVCSLLVL